VFLDYLDRANLRYETPEGAYYVLVDIEKFHAANDLAFCEWLIKEIGVAAVPGSSFFRDNVQQYIRFHFAKKEETLIAAGERLAKLRSY
jgi:L-glutamine---4-(methylsulfanyl)-2-oxobutanoate aminotransferase